MADITTAIGANNIKNGTTLSGVSRRGDVQSHFQTHDLNTPALADIENKYQNRFDDPTYYGSHSSLSTGLIGWYKLNELSGVRRNSAGDNTDMADNNTVGSTTGIVEGGADFVAANFEYLSLTSTQAATFDIDGSFSFSLWVNLDSTSGHMDLVKMWDGGQHKFRLIRLNSSYLRFFTRNADTTEHYIDASTLLSAGQWHHVVCVFEEGVKKTVYVDTSSNSSVSAPDIVTSQDSTMTLGGSAWLDGNIDEFGFWSRALTASEVSSLYNGGAGNTYPGF